MSLQAVREAVGKAAYESQQGYDDLTYTPWAKIAEVHKEQWRRHGTAVLIAGLREAGERDTIRGYAVAFLSLADALEAETTDDTG